MLSLSEIVNEIKGQKKNDHAIIIVFYNEFEYIPKHLDKLSNSYDFILVIGNEADENKLTKYISNYQDYNFIIIRRKYNDGPAGGFYIGYTYAVQNGYKWITFVESDCIPIDYDIPKKMVERNENKTMDINYVNILSYSFGAWRYMTIPSTIKMHICPSLFFYYEDMFSLGFIKDQLNNGQSCVVEHELWYKKSDKSILNTISRIRLSVRNDILVNNLLFHAKRIPFSLLLRYNILHTFSYLLFGFSELLSNPKILKNTLLGILDAITVNSKPNLDKLDEFFHIKETPTNYIVINHLTTKEGIKSLIKAAIDRKDILIDNNFYGIKMLALIPFFKVYVRYQYNYYLINPKRHPIMGLIGIVPSILLSISATFISLITTKIRKFDCFSVYKH